MVTQEIETRSVALNEVFNEWTLVDDVWNGDDQIKSKTTTYLPQEAEESDDSYNTRLKRSIFTNYYRHLITTNASTVFNRSIMFEESEDIINKDIFNDFVANADSEGRDLNQVSESIFESAFNFGVSYVYVDYPILDNPLTLKDERISNIRPYTVEISNLCVIDLRTERVNNEDILVHFRYFDSFVRWDKETFKEELVGRIRVYDLDLEREQPFFSVYEKENGREKWVRIIEPTLIRNQTRIPLVPVYTKRHKPFIGKPPKIDIARLNIRHYQSQSDQINSLHFARIPILHIDGMDELNTKGESGTRKWSINTTINTTGGGTIKWIEHSGKALESGEKDIERTVTQMETLGLSMRLNSKPGSVSATAEAIDKAEADSPVLSAANNLQSSLEKIFEYAGNYLKDDWKPEINIFKKDTVINRDVADVKSVFDSLDKKIITREQALVELKRRGIIQEGFELEALEAPIEIGNDADETGE